MKGASEFCKMFGRSQQVGRLYFETGSHARGSTFRIFGLPEGMTVNNKNLHTTDGVILVFGRVSGHEGWTETYGWIYTGPWQIDFDRILTDKRIAAKIKAETELVDTVRKKNMNDEKISDIRAGWKV